MLAYQRVSAEHVLPERWVLFLHGILGRGANWQGFARKLVRARPDLGAVLVDLRMHGDSQPMPGPHTLAAATEDVRELLAGIDGADTVIGHSFGSKVALGLLQSPRPAVLEALWLLDAAPSSSETRPADDLTSQVLLALEALPTRFADRRAFVHALTERGVERSLALWLAKNLVTAEVGLRLHLDLAAMRSMLADFDRQDYWPLVERPPAGVRLHYVLGGRTHVVSSHDRQRLLRLRDAGTLQLDELPAAGHWLHVDDPEGLLRLLVAGL